MVGEEPGGSRGDQLEVVWAALWCCQRREAVTWANSVNEDAQEEVNATEFGDWLNMGSVDRGVSVSALAPGLGDHLHCWEDFLCPMWPSSWPRSHLDYQKEEEEKQRLCIYLEDMGLTRECFRAAASILFSHSSGLRILLLYFWNGGSSTRWSHPEHQRKLEGF